MYENERQLGESIRSYLSSQSQSITRSDLFIITKIKDLSLPPSQTIQQSISSINLDGYVDLFLIHNPLSGKEGRKEMWFGLEKAKREGLCRSIGVSNL